MLALFSPPVLLFDKCAFVCTLIQYISRFATCQANFSCKLWAREKKKAFSCSNLFDNGWKLSFWCGDSHDWDGAQRNRSSLARWLGLSDDVATATTEMERQRNRSCGSRSPSPHRLPYLYQISIQIIEAYHLLSPAMRHQSIDIMSGRIKPFQFFRKCFHLIAYSVSFCRN